MSHKNNPYASIIRIIIIICVFLSSSTTILLLSTDPVGATSSLPPITFTVGVQHIFAQPGDRIHFTGQASGVNGSIVCGFLLSNSTYIPSNTSYTSQTLSNGSLAIPYQVTLPQSIPIGDQSITLGISIQENQVQSQLAAQVVIEVINSTLMSSTVSISVYDNLNHSRLVRITPYILDAGLSENLTLHNVQGNPVQFQLLTHQQYEFSVLDLQSGKQIVYPSYLVSTGNNILIIPFNLFKTNIILSSNNIVLQFDNELNGSLPVSINFVDHSNTVLFTINTTLLLGRSQWGQSLPSKTTAIHINVGEQTLYIISLHQNTTHTPMGITFTPVLVLETILVIMGIISGSLTVHRYRKGSSISPGGPSGPTSPIDTSKNESHATTSSMTMNEITTGATSSTSSSTIEET